jgi:hypothetical protein
MLTMLGHSQQGDSEIVNFEVVQFTSQTKTVICSFSSSHTSNIYIYKSFNYSSALPKDVIKKTFLHHKIMRLRATVLTNIA